MARSISRAVTTSTRVDAGRGRQRHRPRDQDRPGAPPRGLGGEGEPHLAARPVAEEADGIDRLEGGAGADQHGPAGERPEAGGGLDRLDDLLRLGHPPHADLARGERPLDGTGEADAAPAPASPRAAASPPVSHIAECMAGADHQRAGEGERGGGQEVVAEPEGQPGQDVGGGRRHAQHLRPGRGGDVRLLARAGRRQVLLLVDAVAGEHLQRQRRHERDGAAGQSAAHLVTARAQAAHQLGRLVGRDAAADAEQDSQGGLMVGRIGQTL